ncbi:MULTISPECIES: GGDEF domain-containing protein [Alphaproteobacteria]|uniref:diguanylate cyclase n=2 Tax=Alphaproteobacteria TaxID=28211 RepID=A0A512HPS2_9HYPH|nr:MULTISPECIES: GGDEF domain-containing protein [Alphaproteobacteria]GEO87454.1 GGDEF domain-containing protein [Ciceribacter naphthalenivorans]GLR23412.1 GGDEF domain-containing protein [Ciceribacter naphthalenivorans]GLT06268.1 GGDEF domain-containing protein [Sphingomonas psychrolutea]
MLDIKTALLLWAMEAATLATLLTAIWLQDRTQRHFAMWAFGFLAHGTGVALIGLRGEVPDFLSIEFANAVALSSFIFWAGGLVHPGRAPFMAWAAIPLLIWIGGMLIPGIRDEIAYRIAVYYCASACGQISLAAAAAHHQFSKPRYRRQLAAICALQAVFSLLVAFASIITMPSSIQTAPYAAAAICINLFSSLSAILIGARIVIDRSEERLRQLIRTDPLTGALNRRGLQEGFERLAGPSAIGAPCLALLLFDLDHFKRINDAHGHQAGDTVLLTFAELCRNLMPKGGIFGRTGGEEFMVLARVGELKDAALLAEAIRQSLAAKAIEAGNKVIGATVSIGIAIAPARDANLDQLMSNADRALYKAKARGRNRTTVLSGERVLTVPVTGPEATDEQTDRQVAALKRLMAKAVPQTGVAKP